MIHEKKQDAKGVEDLTSYAGRRAKSNPMLTVSDTYINQKGYTRNLIKVIICGGEVLRHSTEFFSHIQF